MSCDVLSCDELSSVVKWCGAMGWDLMSLWCDVAGCHVTLCGSKWLCGVNWKMIWWSVLHRSTPYYTVLLQYYSSTTPVLLCTRKYYSSIDSVLQLYYKVLLLCTTKYYSSTTLYYKVLLRTTKVLLQYYSVLQSTTPVLLCTTKKYSLQGAEHQRHQMLWLPRKVTLQDHQILPLPRKMTLMIDVRRIWNVIYNARSNRHHPPTSPNTAPATQNDSHDWCPSHMTRHLQCAEQQISSSNITKYCACHAKWLSWLMSVAYETSFTMRGATGITLQPHQILRLPCKMTLMIDLRRIWNVIYNARSNRHHPPTSPNTAPATQNCTPKSKKNLPKTAEASIPMRDRSEPDPTMIRPWTRHLAPARSPRLLLALRRRILYWKLQHFALRLSIQISPNTVPATKSDTPTSPNAAPATQNDSHHLSPWHMKRYLQCAEKQASPANLTKYCACHAKWLASSILVTYETLFTMRGGTGITRQHHQILRLPRKMTLMIDVRRIWNVIYNARSNRHHPPTSPNTAPATQNDIPKSKRNSLKTVEVAFTMRGRFEHDPNMIRAWTRHLAPARSPRLLVALRRRILYWKLQHFALRLSIQISPNTAPATKSDTPTILHLPRKVTLRHHQMLRLPRKVTLRHHQILRLPRIGTWNLNALLLYCYFYCTVTLLLLLLHCYFYCTVTLWLHCYFTVTFTALLLYCYFYCTVTFTALLLLLLLLLHCYFTVTFYCTVTFTALLLYDCTVTLLLLLLHCYFTVTFTALLLLLHCYFTVTFTALLLYYCTVTLLLLLLHCYFTVTLLLHCYFTVTFTALLLLLHCYFMTALLLYCYFYCTVTLLLLSLHCYFTVTFTALLLYCYFITALLLYCYFYCTVTLLLLLLHF